MRHAPAICLTASLIWVAVSSFTSIPINGSHYLAFFLTGCAYWIDYERSRAHARTSTDAD